MRQYTLNQRVVLLAALGFGTVYLVLLSYTAFLILTLVKIFVSPPQTIHEIFSIVKVGAGYPFVYLGFEWVTFYCVKPSWPAN